MVGCDEDVIHTYCDNKGYMNIFSSKIGTVVMLVLLILVLFGVVVSCLKLCRKKKRVSGLNGNVKKNKEEMLLNDKDAKNKKNI